MNTILKNDTFEYPLRYYEKDANGNLKTVSLLNFMQDVATQHAELNGFGPSFIFAHNLAWFVLKYKVIFYENIEHLSDIKIKTESRGVSKLFAYRDFYFYSGNKLFARANSLWALVDFSTKKMVKPLDVLKNITEYEKRDDDISFDKIQPIQNITVKKDYRIRYDDIDINQHVNNASYMSWALEVFDFDFRKNHYIETFDINYKKDIALNASIHSIMSFDEETKTSLHSILNAVNNEELCTLKIVWKEIKH